MWSIPVLVLLASTPAGRAPLAERVLEVSARFLGTPYVHSPLGEGEGLDPDPLIRFDAVDCLTFVEETLALATSPTPADMPLVLQSLRYADTVSYEGRNHLMEAEWIPNNVRKGFLRDVTREIGGSAVVSTRKVITEVSWGSESSRALQLPPERHVTGAFDFDVLPLRAAIALKRAIPPGTLLLVVREDRPGKVTRITHLGFVVQKKGRTYLRHAARGIYRRVVEEDLETFLTRNSKYAKWPVVGVTLLEPRAPEDVLQAAGARAGR